VPCVFSLNEIIYLFLVVTFIDSDIHVVIQSLCWDYTFYMYFFCTSFVIIIIGFVRYC